MKTIQQQRKRQEAVKTMDIEKNHSKTKESVSIFSDINVELTGGVDLLMLNGNLK